MMIVVASADIHKNGDFIIYPLTPHSHYTCSTGKHPNKLKKLTGVLRVIFRRRFVKKTLPKLHSQAGAEKGLYIFFAFFFLSNITVRHPHSSLVV